jgi:hypothetical protein
MYLIISYNLQFTIEMGTNFYWASDDNDTRHIGKRWGGFGVCRFIWYKKFNNIKALNEFAEKYPQKKCVVSENGSSFTASEFLDEIIKECVAETESDEQFS